MSANRSLLERARAAWRAFRGTPKARSAYQAAMWNRLTDWSLSASRSADSELRYELRTMRNRARDLVKNTPFAARYAQLIAENVIGPDGITLQAKNQTKEGVLYARANQAIEDAWKDWCLAENSDAARKFTFTEHMSVGVANWGTDGELLIRLYRGPQFGKYGLRIQVLDPDFLDENLNQEPQNGLPAIRQGVELDQFGGPVAYHLWTRHPYDNGTTGLTANQQRIRVPAEDVIHAFIPLRTGQSRGVPHAAAVMQTLKILDGYIEAELVAARTASAKMGALVDLPENMGTPNPNAGSGDIPAEAEPGSLLDLRGMGAKLEMWDPQHPTTGFPDFTRAMSRFVAIGLGISYGALSGDLSDANYSSMKVGQQPERDHWRRLQRFVIEHVYARVFREWLAMALLNGRIPTITDYDVDRWTRVSWRPRGWPSPDPLKDAEADYMHVAAGTKTLTRIAAENGDDLEELIEERKQELAALKAAGIESVLPIAQPKGAADTVNEGDPAAKKPDPNRALRSA